MSDNLDLSASITTEEPEIAATLSDLRYLVFQGLKGDTGDSAYEEAVALGFVGTETEWLASLKGEKGDKGDVGALADLDASYDETTKTLSLGTNATSLAIEDRLSATSTNPVQNRIITGALNGKQDKLTAGQNVTISGNTISAEVDSAEIASNVTDWLDDNVTPVGSAVVVDSSLSVQGAAADAKATGEAIAAAKTAAKNETIAEITEPSASGDSGNGNVVDPSNIKKLGYYFNTSDGVTHVADANNQWLVSEDKIPLGDTDIVVYAMTRVAVGLVRNYEILCYQGDNYLGKANSNFTLETTSAKLISLKPYTNAIRVQCNTYGDAINPADLCICLDKFDTFVEYGGGSGEPKIKESLIDTESILSGITEMVVDSNNLVDPKNFRAWGYYWNPYGQGVWSGPATYQWQSTKEKIAVGSAVDLYARIRNPVDGNLYSVSVLCYNGDSYLGTAGLIQINTTDEQHFTLKQGTDRIALTLNIYETTFDSKDICVSLVSLDEFEEYSYSLKIKPSAIPSDSDIALSVSKRSSLYKKNVIFFGDSIIGNGKIPFYVGQMTGAKVYNAGVGGTSMSDRGGNSIYTKWYTMTNLADCIASGDWADTFAGINASSENDKEAALKRAQYLSQLNWNTDVDMIVVMYGANDQNTDNANDRLDVTTYAGATRHVIETLLTAYPHIKIVFCTVIYRTGGENGGTVGKRDKLIDVCKEYNLQCIDNYSTLGINALTASTYLADGLHPSENGLVLMYNHIAQELW